MLLGSKIKPSDATPAARPATSADCLPSMGAVFFICPMENLSLAFAPAIVCFLTNKSYMSFALFGNVLRPQIWTVCGYILMIDPWFGHSCVVLPHRVTQHAFESAAPSIIRCRSSGSFRYSGTEQLVDSENQHAASSIGNTMSRIKVLCLLYLGLKCPTAETAMLHRFC